MSAENPLADVPVRDVLPDGSVRVWLESWIGIGPLTHKDQERKALFLAMLVREGAARRDAYGAPAFASALVGSLRGVDALRKLHEWVRDWIAYEDETIERLETAAYVLRERAADCDGQAVLLGTLALSLGASVALAPMGGAADDPQHLAIALRPNGAEVVVLPWQPMNANALPGPEWIWCETTIEARFGELPAAAYARTGGRGRSDLQ